MIPEEEQHTHDPEVDLDPQEVLDVDYNPDTDIPDSEGEPNDDAGEEFVHEPVDGALPVDDSCADMEFEEAEDEISDEEDEEDSK